MRKLNSWKKQESSNPSETARAKFDKNFVQKPKDLLKNFPVSENPEKWKPPNRVPRVDVSYSEKSQLHTELIANLRDLFELENRDETLPEILENTILLNLTKMRAEVYKIAIYESDGELLRRAKKRKSCRISIANLASQFILHEIRKLQNGLQSQDWWITERDGFAILHSKTQPKLRKIGNLTLTQWDNLSVKLEEEWTLADFLEHVLTFVGLNVNMITQKSKMIYCKALPTHVKKTQKM